MAIQFDVQQIAAVEQVIQASQPSQMNVPTLPARYPAARGDVNGEKRLGLISSQGTDWTHLIGIKDFAMFRCRTSEVELVGDEMLDCYELGDVWRCRAKLDWRSRC